MLVVNLFAGPGTGKSTTAAGVFHLLKLAGVNCELVREYAKDVVWEGRSKLLEDQVYIFAKQAKRLRDLEGQVDIAVTDAPILMSLVYAEGFPQAFHDLVRWEHGRYWNFDVLLRRVKPYKTEGRLQTEGEARTLDERIEAMLSADEKTAGYYEFDADDDASRKLVVATRGLLRLRQIATDRGAAVAGRDWEPRDEEHPSRRPGTF